MSRNVDEMKTRTVFQASPMVHVFMTGSGSTTVVIALCRGKTPDVMRYEAGQPTPLPVICASNIQIQREQDGTAPSDGHNASALAVGDPSWCSQCTGR